MRVVELVASGLNDPEGRLERARVVETTEGQIGGYFVSAEVQGAGELSGSDDIGTWYLTAELRAVGNDDVYSMTGFERSISRWPFPAAEVSMATNGAGESRLCAARR